MPRKRTYKVKVELIQTGWVKVKAESMEKAIEECAYIVGGDLWPLGKPMGDEVADFDYDRADIVCSPYRERKRKSHNGSPR